MRPGTIPERTHGSALPAAELTGWHTLPNLLTIARIILIAPFVWLCIHGLDVAALAVFVIAGLTDMVDGTLARRFGQRSKFGRLADPLADKLLTTVAFLVLSLFRVGLRAIPLWLVLVVIGRDLLILTGALIVYLRTRSTGFRPNLFGKANTFLELGLIVLVLASSRLPEIARFLAPLYILLLASLLVSTAEYLLQGLRMLRESRAD